MNWLKRSFDLLFLHLLKENVNIYSGSNYLIHACVKLGFYLYHPFLLLLFNKLICRKRDKLWYFCFSCLINQKEVLHFRWAKPTKQREWQKTKRLALCTLDEIFFRGMFWQTTVGVTPKARQMQTVTVSQTSCSRLLLPSCPCLSALPVQWASSQMGNYLTVTFRASRAVSSRKRSCRFYFIYHSHPKKDLCFTFRNGK